MQKVFLTFAIVALINNVSAIRLRDDMFTDDGDIT